MTWKLDNSHTKVGFAVRHMMISKVRGDFKSFEADIDLDPSDLAGSSIKAKIDVSSIDTNDEKRDGHLLSEDFFAADEYPTIEFNSTELRDNGDGAVEIAGDLTIRGVTRPIVLTGEQLGPAQSPWGGLSVGYSLTGEVNREDFGLSWNQALETGGVLVGKKVEIIVEAEAAEAE
ncbi:MAG: YceI family protein [Persicimonas sp.]